MRAHIYVRKHLTCAINVVLVENLRERKSEALTLYYKSLAKLKYLLHDINLTPGCYYYFLGEGFWHRNNNTLIISEAFSRPFQSVLSQGNHNVSYMFCTTTWDRVSNGKLYKQLTVTSSQKLTLCSNNDFVKWL